MENYNRKFSEYLKNKGLKFTPERKNVMEEVFSIHKHFNIDELYDRLRKQGKHISRATIYRILPLLINSGLIQSTFRCQDMINYEHIFGHKHHDHLVCVKCGKIIEFKNEKIEELQKAICKKYGFKEIEHKLGIKGYCRVCLAKMKNGT